MDNSIANAAIERFLGIDETAVSNDAVNTIRMQADIALRYLKLQKIKV